jgi:hypothetical protein
MTPDTTSVPARSRRAIIMGALGGLAALAANAVRPLEARAGVDGDVVLNTTNAGLSTTGIINSTNTATVFYAASNGAGNGLTGSSQSAIGVSGLSSTSVGVFGSSQNDSVGVLGYSGGTNPPTRLKTGVYGIATQDANSRGVWGTAYAGRGVFGEATSGLGVRGFAQSGVGLSGEATSGYALRTTGRVRLDKSAGTATVAAGTATKQVTPGIDLTSTSAVVATLNGDAGGSVAVKRVSINTTANTFTIVLTGNAASSVKVAWIVLG